MPKANLERNSFIRGLITEASPLTFPENASIAEDNFVLNKDGSRQRRLGMDYEQQGALVPIDGVISSLGNYAVQFFKWDNVANISSLSIGVVQIGETLYFLDLSADAPSANLLNGGAGLTITAISSGIRLDFSVIQGKLVFSVPFGARIYVLEYDNATDSISSSYDVISVRDIWGEDDGLAVDERPSTLSEEHRYNLKNQGWGQAQYDNVKSARGVYPSNADIVHLAKDSSDEFNSTILVRQFFGTTPAPKGKYIIPAFGRKRGRLFAESGISSPVVSNEGFTLLTTSFAGRVFYAGARNLVRDLDNSKDPDFNGAVFYSRIVRTNDDIYKCYQEADPTSEHISDLVATDGGVILIQDAKNISALINKETSLVVVAENGVWEITGPDGVFRADDYSVSQITNIGAIGKNTIVNAEGVIYYWSESGIYRLIPNEVTGRLQAENLTESTIQSFYVDIPDVGKLYSKGVYDKLARKMRWLYNDSSSYDGVTFRYKYNKELILDLVTGAFTTHSIDISVNPFVCEFVQIDGFVQTDKVDDILVGSEEVFANIEQVQITTQIRGRGVSQVKYLTMVTEVPGTILNYFTLSSYNNGNFKDWETYNDVGIDAPAYLVTGYELFQDSQRKKYLPYLTLHFKRTETGFSPTEDGSLTADNESSCLVRAEWDFADSSAGGKYGSQFQGYRLNRAYFPLGIGDSFDYGRSVITTKNKIRGSGTALSLRFDTEPGKDLYLYGWGMSVSGNRNV